MAGYSWNQSTLATLSDQSNIASGLAWDSSLGKMFLAWAGTDLNHDLNIISSSDLKTWGNKVTTSISANAPGLTNWVDLTYDSANQKLYASYEFAPWPNWYFYVTSSTDGISWSSPVLVTSGSNPLETTNGLSITYNDANQALVVAGNNADNGGHDFVYKSTDEGSTWSAGIEVQYNGSPITPYYTPNIKFTNGKYFLTYTAPYSLHVLQSTDLNTWTSQSNPAFNGYDSPAIIYNPSEALYHLVWHGTGGDGIWDATSSDGVTWGSATSLSQTSLWNPVLEIASGVTTFGSPVMLVEWTGRNGVNYGYLNAMQYQYGGGSGGGSLESGTIITMADDRGKPVQDLKVGDQMMGYDPLIGQEAVSKVTSIMEVSTSTLLVIQTAQGLPLRTDASPTEFLWTKQVNGNIGWLPVTLLRPGDSLFTTGGWVLVTSIQGSTGWHTMYDIAATLPYFANGYLDPPIPS